MRITAGPDITSVDDAGATYLADEHGFVEVPQSVGKRLLTLPGWRVADEDDEEGTIPSGSAGVEEPVPVEPVVPSEAPVEPVEAVVEPVAPDVPAEVVEPEAEPVAEAEPEAVEPEPVTAEIDTSELPPPPAES